MTSFGSGTISGCRVRCSYKNMADLPMSGRVTFTAAPKVMANSEVNTMYYPTPVVALLSSGGAIDLVLFATDDQELNPYNWTYQVYEEISDTASGTSFTNSYAIKAPSGGDIFLSDVVPVTTNVGQAIVRGPRGSTADFAALAIALGG